MPAITTLWPIALPGPRYTFLPVPKVGMFNLLAAQSLVDGGIEGQSRVNGALHGQSLVNGAVEAQSEPS